MVTALIAAIASVLVVLITVVGQIISTRNDRQTALLEVQLLAKLPPDSRAAQNLEKVITTRSMLWSRNLEHRYLGRLHRLSVYNVAVFLILTSVRLASDGDPERAREIGRSFLKLVWEASAVLMLLALLLAFIAQTELILRNLWMAMEKRKAKREDIRRTRQNGSTANNPDQG